MTDEIQALRRVAQILAGVATPIERQNIARRVAQKVKGDDSELALSLPHAAALFWPGDAEKTAEVLQQITRAFDAGELGGFIPREHRHLLFTDFIVWPDCPPMAADSPLRYWVPDAPVMQPQTPAPAPVVNSPSNAPGKVWTDERLAEVSAYRKKHGTKKTAEHYGVSEALIRQKLPGEKPKPKGYSAFTHRPK
ncbi:hypothetical protein [Alicycliphilus denitrificans]|uniref:DNA primase DnaB-helicase binding domain-containing protein n=1 Tax=Alicycliphilus denitrificans (strain DSM 14773 / CIP 107495 / K601) TaxID=596154 RepID=F4G7I0_ALIDK|nr:hypothetical protein [Alicycliphilus denitrificans]AEB85510.1 hypothetical protein Alide2_3169 [Alicycliphilus denitrificans K601]